MATTVSPPRWMVDANVLVFSASPQSPWHAAAVERLRRAREEGVSLAVTPQILREFVVAGTRPAQNSPPPPLEPVLQDLRRLAAGFQVVEENAATVASLAHVLETAPAYGKQVHDANVVATMLVHGIPNLLTHNVADFVRYSGLITVIPLVP